MKVTYTRKGDYLLPDLYLEKEENYGRLGRYGILRLHFISQNKQALYETLLMTNKSIKDSFKAQWIYKWWISYN